MEHRLHLFFVSEDAEVQSSPKKLPTGLKRPNVDVFTLLLFKDWTKD